MLSGPGPRWSGRGREPRTDAAFRNPTGLRGVYPGCALSEDGPTVLTKTPEHIELEERLAFQEHAFEQLNRVVAEQQLELDSIQREVKELRRTARSGGDSKDGETRTLEDDRPPHY